MGKNLHDGHRKRVRAEFLRNGFDKDTPKHKVLEMILFYCVPRVDTNELAHELLEKYRTLNGVLSAPPEELKKFKGITDNGVALLKLILPVANICAQEAQQKKSSFKNLEAIGEYFAKQYLGIYEERLSILLLDGIGRKLDFRFIGEGDVASVGVSMRTIAQACLDTNAVAVALAHNHPSGVALPSHEDLAITNSVAKALRPMGIRLIDHVIVSGDDYVSMAQSARYNEIFK